MQNIAIIKQGTGRYLFSVPENVTLHEGDRVKCDTKRGITDGIAFADSAWVDENVSQLIGKLLGAKFPLKPVVGRLEYLPFEKPQDKPAEPTEPDKQEPIKLYCVKDCPGPCGVSKGKIYDFDGGIEYDNANRQREYDSYEQWKRYNQPYSDVLFPLVKRPAKVGEYVLLDNDDCFHINKQGDVVEVVKTCGDSHFIKDPTGIFPSGICTFFRSNYSYVLDGYHPAPEPEKDPEPEYYNGKVVCVSSGDKFFTVGKMYEFVNGKIKDDEGDERPVCYDQQFKSVEEWNSECGMPIARFIEFKGEAHD